MKELEALDRETRQRILDGLDRLAAGEHADVTKLRGSENEYRLRVGEYRALFARDQQERVIVVFKVAHRREAYR